MIMILADTPCGVGDQCQGIIDRPRLQLIVHKYGSDHADEFTESARLRLGCFGEGGFHHLDHVYLCTVVAVVYESQGKTEIAGLTLADTIWYFLIAEMIELGKFRHDERISEEVKDGSIAYTLIRPYNYLGISFLQWHG